MRLQRLAIRGACIQSSRRLQNASFAGIGAETQRAIGVVRIAVAGVARDDDRPAAHRGRQVGTSAVISYKQMTPLEHGACLPKLRSLRMMVSQLSNFASFNACSRSPAEQKMT